MHRDGELRDKGLIAFYETTPREVVLYFDGLAPNAVVDVPLDLVATVPGEYRASASSGYLFKIFVAVAITPLLYLVHRLIDAWLGEKEALRQIEAVAVREHADDATVLKD